MTIKGHSWAEAVTVEGNRQIAIRGRDGQKKISNNGATTIWLASESSKPVSGSLLMPFGWAIIELS